MLQRTMFSLSLSRACVCVGRDALWRDTVVVVGWGLEPGLYLSGRCWALDKEECQAMWIKDVGL